MFSERTDALIVFICAAVSPLLAAFFMWLWVDGILRRRKQVQMMKNDVLTDLKVIEDLLAEREFGTFKDISDIKLGADNLNVLRSQIGAGLPARLAYEYFDKVSELIDEVKAHVVTLAGLKPNMDDSVWKGLTGEKRQCLAEEFSDLRDELKAAMKTLDELRKSVAEERARFTYESLLRQCDDADVVVTSLIDMLVQSEEFVPGAGTRQQANEVKRQVARARHLLSEDSPRERHLHQAYAVLNEQVVPRLEQLDGAIRMLDDLRRGVLSDLQRVRVGLHDAAKVLDAMARTGRPHARGQRYLAGISADFEQWAGEAELWRLTAEQRRHKIAAFLARIDDVLAVRVYDPATDTFRCIASANTSRASAQIADPESVT